LRLGEAEHHDGALNIKLANTGDGEAFVYGLRILRGYALSHFTNCSGIIANSIEVPALATSRDVPPDLAMAADIANGQSAAAAAFNYHDISAPIKLAQSVPAGGVEWLKVKFTFIEPEKSCHAVNTPANAIIYFNDRYVVTPKVFHFLR
jgi:hypothetical protein